MADPIIPPNDERFIRAGQYVLGVLEGEDLSNAQRELLSDRSFSDAVEWWEKRLAAMAEEAGEYAPSASVWRGIEARLDAEAAPGSNPPVQLVSGRPSNRPSIGSLAALVTGIGMAAAALVLFLATPRPAGMILPDTAARPSEQLIAQLQDNDTGRKLASIVDVGNQRLALTIAGLEAEAGKTPELWVIPEGGAPVSLGAIPQSGRFARNLSSSESDLVVAGATFAVTFEDDTGERHEAPTMPILLLGKLDRV